MPWSSTFDDPITLDDGRQLVTLQDAGLYIQTLTKGEQQKPHWQLAIETLINAAEGRDLVFHANIAMLKAMNHGKPPPSKSPSGKPAKRFKLIR